MKELFEILSELCCFKKVIAKILKENTLIVGLFPIIT